LGQPNGGNGGPGGNVYLRTNDQLTSFKFSTFHFQAGQGKNGGSEMLHGAAGDDLYIDVPPGTIVREILEKDPITHEVKTRFLADLEQVDQVFEVARGAPGGFGNRAFRTGDRPKASISTLGAKAAEKRLELELKMIADVGLVGYPNAGKSSLLGSVSRASPKVAPYPFTTLRPHIGRVVADDLEETTFTMADLPGLVDGAHMNVGLGHEFLRHIERTRILLYVLDVARPVKGSASSSAAKPDSNKPNVVDLGDPVKEFLSLRKELQLYSPELYWRPSIVFCNKIDSKPQACAAQIKRLREVIPEHWPVVAGSAKTGVGIPELIEHIASFLPFVSRGIELSVSRSS